MSKKKILKAPGKMVVQHNFSKMRPFGNLLAFYERIGVEFDSIDEVYANSSTNDYIKEALIRYYTKRYGDFGNRLPMTLAGMTYLDLSPVEDNNVPDGEIWVIRKHDARSV